MVVCGRHFANEMISRIQDKVDAEPELSRRQLSRQVCEGMEGRAPNGRLQEMRCRKALGEIHRPKIFKLPERGRIFGLAGSNSIPGAIEIAHVTRKVEEVGEINGS